MSQGRFTGHADRPAVDRVDGDVPETGARRGDAGRKGVERATVVGMTAAILEAAEVGVVHQADVAHLGALDDDDVVFVEVLALVYKFHGRLQKGFFYKIKTIAMGDWRSLSARRRYYRVVEVRFGNKKPISGNPWALNAVCLGEKQRLCCRRVFIGGFI